MGILVERDTARDTAIVLDYLDSRNLKATGRRFDICGERVRQILRRNGVTERSFRHAVTPEQVRGAVARPDVTSMSGLGRVTGIRGRDDLKAVLNLLDRYPGQTLLRLRVRQMKRHRARREQLVETIRSLIREDGSPPTLAQVALKLTSGRSDGGGNAYRHAMYFVGRKSKGWQARGMARAYRLAGTEVRSSGHPGHVASFRGRPPRRARTLRKKTPPGIPSDWHTAIRRWERCLPPPGQFWGAGRD